MSIYLTALAKSKEGRSEAFKVLLLDLVRHSRLESACIQYDLHQSKEDPDLFIFHEEWDSEEGLSLHNTQAHILKFRDASKDLTDGATMIHKTEKLA